MKKKKYIFMFVFWSRILSNLWIISSNNWYFWSKKNLQQIFIIRFLFYFLLSGSYFIFIIRFFILFSLSGFNFIFIIRFLFYLYYQVFILFLLSGFNFIFIIRFPDNNTQLPDDKRFQPRVSLEFFCGSQILINVS